MPKLNVKDVSLIVREYFDEIKKSKFIFDIISVELEEDEEVWSVECEITNVFEEEPRQYEIMVDDETGDILNVCETTI
ncbi:hypothetical protein B6V01_004165 [Methanosarcinales archaeon ex4572_44]|nr:MAG: hypothetical protein B6U67_01095 [Methanosarcinales archaeon ex4484_138]PHP45392.1 MAG: hypothetical protein B6V01_004165 [Methanosarcinales archaeon ex4572_44]RLG24201.1 MAG: hypothetical protein DRN85_08065 [Methanosarcinales archaeon]RLG27549.1 MAG: hypothetical protein DRN70_02040 [Methanosarcinales archaeon]HHI30502.1 hypothetical protein [Candidatus Methanoperedenaceae archaeon]